MSSEGAGPITKFLTSCAKPGALGCRTPVIFSGRSWSS